MNQLGLRDCCRLSRHLLFRDGVTVARRGDLSVMEVASESRAAKESVRLWMGQLYVDDGS